MKRNEIYEEIGRITKEKSSKKREMRMREFKKKLYLQNTKTDIAKIKELIQFNFERKNKELKEKKVVYYKKYEKIKPKSIREEVDFHKKENPNFEKLVICDRLLREYKEYKKIEIVKDIPVNRLSSRDDNGKPVMKDITLKKGKEMLVVDYSSSKNATTGVDLIDLLDIETNYTHTLTATELKGCFK
jgi:hypothetical protein